MAALDDLDTVKNNITTGLDATTLTTIVQESWREVHSSEEAFEIEVKRRVLAKANALNDNNPKITVDGFAKDADGTTDLFTLTAPTKAAEDSNAKISFTLHLKDEDTQETEANADDFKLEITEKQIGAIAEFQSPEELLTAATNTEVTKIKEIDYVETEEAALAAIKAKVVALNENPAYNAAATVVVEKTENMAEQGQSSNGTVFTKPEGNSTGSITKVVVKTGTSNEATLATVTIKKQVTTPAVP